MFVAIQAQICVRARRCLRGQIFCLANMPWVTMPLTEVPVAGPAVIIEIIGNPGEQCAIVEQAVLLPGFTDSVRRRYIMRIAFAGRQWVDTPPSDGPPVSDILGTASSSRPSA